MLVAQTSDLGGLGGEVVLAMKRSSSEEAVVRKVGFRSGTIGVSRGRVLPLLLCGAVEAFCRLRNQAERVERCGGRGRGLCWRCGVGGLIRRLEEMMKMMMRGVGDGAVGAPGPALAAGLFGHSHSCDEHVLVDGFAHIVDGESGHIGGGEGFHLHTGFAVAGDVGRYLDAAELKACFSGEMVGIVGLVSGGGCQ